MTAAFDKFAFFGIKYPFVLRFLKKQGVKKKAGSWERESRSQADDSFSQADDSFSQADDSFSQADEFPFWKSLSFVPEKYLFRRLMAFPFLLPDRDGRLVEKSVKMIVRPVGTNNG
jgi:hypothetical protein